MKGRKPIPADIQRLKHGGDRDSGGREILDSLSAPQGVPPMPEGLSAQSIAEWEAITNDLDTLGVLAITDRAALQLYIENWEIKRMAFSKLTPETLVTENANRTLGASKYLKIYNDSASACGDFLAQFGLTPAARERIKIKPKVEDKPEIDLT